MSPSALYLSIGEDRVPGHPLPSLVRDDTRPPSGGFYDLASAERAEALRWLLQSQACLKPERIQ